MPRPDLSVPPQLSGERWFNSFLLGREVELGELYDLSDRELDLLQAEAATLWRDPETNRHKRLFASYFGELARVITTNRQALSNP